MNLPALIDHLQAISEMFAKAKEPWRSGAFGNAASKLRNLDTLDFDSDGKLIDKIPGVGSAIKTVIEEFNATGTSEKYKRLIRAGYEDAIVHRFDALLIAARVATLLSPLTKARVDWGFAGSMRRGNPQVKDVDIIIVDDDGRARQILLNMLTANKLTPDVRDGKQKVGVSFPIEWKKKITLDFNFATSENRGAVYLYFTGSRSFNINMRGEAKDRGLLLNQNGLFRGKIKLASQTEEQIFHAMGWKFIPPEKRL